MPKYQRPLFEAGRVYQAAKVVTINGASYVPGDRLSGDQIIDIGEARLKKLFDARLIDFATDDVPEHYQRPAPAVVDGEPDGEPAKEPDGEGGTENSDPDGLLAANAAAAEKLPPPEPEKAAPAAENGADSAKEEGEPAKEGVSAISGAHTVKHFGFGKWFIMDGETKIDGPYTKKEALALIDAAKVAGV